LFRFLVAHLGKNDKLDAFDAIAASLYTEGKTNTYDDDLYSHLEMALELRLNLVAFYRRCARYPFTSSILETWSQLALEEYNYAVENDLAYLNLRGSYSLFPRIILNGWKTFKFLLSAY
jgi:hypothetical protein